MYRHQWSFQGKLLKAIDGHTLQIWVDLGFGIWKTIIVRLNRVRVIESYGTQNDWTSRAHSFFETSLKRKDIVVKIYKKEDRYKNDRYYAEIYAYPKDLPTLALKDINRTISSRFRIGELINVNDFLVNQGMAEHVERDNFSGNHRPSRADSEVRDVAENSYEEQDIDDTLGSGSTPEG